MMAHADFNGNGDQSLRFYPKRYPWVYTHFFKRMQQAGVRFGLVGHSHLQLIYQYIPGEMQASCVLLDNSTVYDETWRAFPEPETSLFLINPGGLGQPRSLDEFTDRDTRAKYMLLDTRGDHLLYKFRQIVYPKEKTAALLDQTVVLPDTLPDGCITPNDTVRLLSDALIQKLRRSLDMQVYQMKLTLGIDDF
jgi:hypothetical protein